MKKKEKKKAPNNSISRARKHGRMQSKLLILIHPTTKMSCKTHSYDI